MLSELESIVLQLMLLSEELGSQTKRANNAEELLARLSEDEATVIDDSSEHYSRSGKDGQYAK